MHPSISTKVGIWCHRKLLQIASDVLNFTVLQSPLVLEDDDEDPSLTELAEKLRNRGYAIPDENLYTKMQGRIEGVARLAPANGAGRTGAQK
ncbi:hypothetical protein AVEN_27866-1 [Araneus ventricosus]|uniref:Uncharacterized protein n=1 Tax=Araneus ventricosus TaxID=182803 RepID=A0A4Y2M666_ARAVE|nr:hypothetical protein AVEN_27866-1 [Araneus ventricosus]